MSDIIIAIDGHSSCGKSTLAKELARSLSYAYVDSGAMYRAVTLYLLDKEIDYNQEAVLRQALDDIEIKFVFNPEKGQSDTFLNDKNVEAEIRTMRVSRRVSEIAAIKQVRASMVKIQRRAGINGGIVMDGRDIGSHVFPDAELKIFMTASIDVRVERRYHELLERGLQINREKVKENLISRDRIDSTRDENPLRQVEDARILDTTELTRKEQLAIVVKWVEDLIRKEEK